MEQIMNALRDPLSFSVIAGVIGTIVVAVITRAEWSTEAKRWTALIVFAALTLVGILISYYPAQWEMILSMLAVVVGVGQTVFTVLKPTGIFNWLEDWTTPGYTPQHAAPTKSLNTSDVFLDDPVGPLTDSE